MGKDFDKDDFSWMRDPDDDDNGNQSEDDFPDLDWLTDDTDKQPKAGDSQRSGVTGQLPWMRDRDAAADETSTPDEDDSFDWMTNSDDKTAKPDSKRLGVTGELSWLGSNKDEGETTRPDSARTGVTGQLDWRNASTSLEDQLAAAEKAAGVQRDLPPLTPADDEPLLDDIDEVPDWLRGTDNPADEFTLDEDDELEAVADDVPDWLQGAAPTGAANFNFDALDESEAADEYTFDFDTDDEPAAAISPTGSADTPSWLTDMTSDDDEDTPSWLTGSTTDDELEVEDAFGSMFEDDLFAQSDENISAEVDDFDLLGELTSDTGGKTGLTDLLNTAAIQDDDLDEEIGIPDDADFFNEFLAVQDQPVDDSMDWLSDLEPGRTTAVPAVQSTSSDLEDVDDFLASLDDGSGLGLADEQEFVANETDLAFDDLFADAAFDRLNTSTATIPAPSPDAPDWLANVSISDVSAAAIVRRQTDRPLEELSDRLHLLRDEAEKIPSPQPAEANRNLSELIPDLGDALNPASIEVMGNGGIASQLNLTAEQSRKVALLTTLTGASAAASEALLGSTAQSAPRRLSLKIDRLVITLLVAAAVILPFFGILQIGDLPPSIFIPGSPQQAVFDYVNNLAPGQTVLFAAEYGAAAAGELDSATEILLRHVFQRQAQPVIVSSNPVSLLRAETHVKSIAGDTLIRNNDYFIGNYIAGANIGLRGFSQNITSLTANDLYGDPTGLQINSLDDFALIIVIAENVDSVRVWSEQIAPQTQTQLVFVTGYAASPLAVPYIQAAGNGAMLTGYRDAYTYAQLLNNPLQFLLPTTEEITSTPFEQASPTRTPIFARPTTAGQTPDTASIIATDIPATAEPTQSEATVSEAATTITTQAETTSSSASNTPASTETPVPDTATPTTEIPRRFAEVDAQQPVNVREGPGRSFAVVGVVQPGDVVEVLDENEDTTWYKILLEDGKEGWISADLLEFEDETANLSFSIGLGSGFSNLILQTTATTAAELVQTPVPVVQPAFPIPYEDERWYGMTLGIIAIIVIIIAGNVLSLLRRAASKRGRS